MDSLLINQKSGSPYNIFPEHFELQLFKVFRELKLLGGDYLYFLASDGNSSHRFCTNEYWINLYNDEKLNMNDPLKRISESNALVIVPWRQVTYLNGNEKKTMEGRSSFGLFNGLSLAKKIGHKKFIFALATETKEHDLSRYLLLENTVQLEKIISNCMQLFNQFIMLMANSSTSVM